MQCAGTFGLRLGVVGVGVASLALVGCGSSGGTVGDGGSDASTNDAPTVPDTGSDVVVTNDASADGGLEGGAGTCTTDALDSNRDRLLATYLAFLKSYATTPQTNGLSGSNVTSVCDIWSKLDPSSRDVFLTLTARLQGSKLGSDKSSMLCHVVKIYRVSGGQGATATDPGSCGGGEYNRMIMSQDMKLHDAQVAANDHQGALQPNNAYDIADTPTGTFWRDSHDLGGPHAPFDLSDETDTGAPRGQTQYFRDPSSTLANTALGRQDLTTLVDPLALEMDQDYDCVHNSNPDCTYVTYGQFCVPQSSQVGTAIYTQNYGTYEPSWKPTGCP